MRKWQGYKYVVGVDEVGRGPVAGPVAVGAVVVKQTQRNKSEFKSLMRGVKDSKQLSRSSREEWFKKLDKAREAGAIDYAVSFVGQKVIDSRSITFAIALATKRSLYKLKIDPNKAMIILDGGLKADNEWGNQKTIIRGDEKEALISAASIVAKVLRDKRMTEYSKRHPRYGFDRNKGYGTKLHMSAIEKYGKSKLHRKTFLKTKAGSKSKRFSKRK